MGLHIGRLSSRDSGTRRWGSGSARPIGHASNPASLVPVNPRGDGNADGTGRASLRRFPTSEPLLPKFNESLNCWKNYPSKYPASRRFSLPSSPSGTHPVTMGKFFPLLCSFSLLRGIPSVWRLRAQVPPTPLRCRYRCGQDRPGTSLATRIALTSATRASLVAEAEGCISFLRETAASLVFPCPSCPGSRFPSRRADSSSSVRHVRAPSPGVLRGGELASVPESRGWERAGAS